MPLSEEKTKPLNSDKNQPGSHSRHKTHFKFYCSDKIHFISQISYLILFIILLQVNNHVAANSLSEEARISVLTCGPGQPLYATFGHAAFRVNDPGQSIDEVYNFGTFNFETKNFYLKFLSGKLDYILAVDSYNNFLQNYSLENRWVYEQDLNLSHKQMQALYDTLLFTSKATNRNYRYDFFNANCATKIIDFALAEANNPAALEVLRAPANITFRDALNHYLSGREWTRIGINFLLGPYADQQITKLQSAFLPDYLLIELENSELAASPVELLAGEEQVAVPDEFSVAMVLFWLLLIILVLEVFWFNLEPGISDAIDSGLFLLSSLAGFMLLSLWIWSEHQSLHVNLNIFWANPLNMIAVLALKFKKSKLLRIYLGLYVLLLFFFLINWNRMPQHFPIELMPVVTILVFRSVNRVFQFRKIEAKSTDSGNLSKQ